MGWPCAQITGARPLHPSHKCVGRAVTMRFVPARPDIAQDKPPAGESPEYEAFELTGSNDVLVMSSVGPWESVGGDIKFLRLKQRAIGGLVTDGSVRDTDEIINYGFPTFCHSTTAKQGPAAMQPWECNGVISCGGVVVRPGDAIVGDQDGVVVVPAKVADKVYDIAHGREVIEEIVKEELIKNPGESRAETPMLCFNPIWLIHANTHMFVQAPLESSILLCLVRSSPRVRLDSCSLPKALLPKIRINLKERRTGEGIKGIPGSLSYIVIKVANALLVNDNCAFILQNQCQIDTTHDT